VLGLFVFGKVAGLTPRQLAMAGAVCRFADGCALVARGGVSSLCIQTVDTNLIERVGAINRLYEALNRSSDSLVGHPAIGCRIMAGKRIQSSPALEKLLSANRPHFASDAAGGNA